MAEREDSSQTIRSYSGTFPVNVVAMSPLRPNSAQARYSPVWPVSLFDKPVANVLSPPITESRNYTNPYAQKQKAPARGTVDDILPVLGRGVCRESPRNGVRILLAL